MCGIFAYAGKLNAGPLIIDGLKRLEYRGYDSWGLALIDQKGIQVTKRVGPIGDLTEAQNLPFSQIGIGHTRWATHGGVTENNAHPHFSSDKSFVVAQNGIVENYQELKKRLVQKGYSFRTQTDTEVIVRSIEFHLTKKTDLAQATKTAFLELTGRNTIIVLAKANSQIIAIRHGSPLVLGLKGKEIIFASDTLSFANLTKEVIFINDWEMVNYEKGELSFYNLKANQPLRKKSVTLTDKEVKIDKEGYDSFYLKEVMEQPETIKSAVLYSREELQPLLTAIKKARQIYTLGAGSASFAAGEGAYYLRLNNRLPVIELKAYEVKSYAKLFRKNDLLIAVSQSGETADVLEAIEIAKARGVKIGSIVNMVGSTLSRESDYPYYTRSGPEISVVSTKAFTAQVAWFQLVSATLLNREKEFGKIILRASQKLRSYSQESYLKKIEALAKRLVKEPHHYILGRDENFYLAHEAAMKIKEISYLHAEAFAAGELKHGVIALINKGTPVFGVLSGDKNEATLSALAEVKARGAYVVGIGPKPNDLFDFWVETVEVGEIQPIANLIPIQLLGYYLARIKHLSPDKPRNLAKSVTVK